MNLTIISILRMALAGALPPLAAMTRSAPMPTVARPAKSLYPATPLCKDGEPDRSRSPHPFDILAIYALCHGARR